MIIRIGARGPGVRDLQKRLNAAGYGSLVADGIFGPATQAAVRLFQAAERLDVDGVVGPRTLAALGKREAMNQDKPSAKYPAVVLACERLGHSIHLDGQINLIGVRSSNREAGKFDDHIHLAWVEDGLWSHRTYPATTDPGIPWLEDGPDKGTAILCPGSWPVYKFDNHQGRVGYRTLCQRAGSVKVYRDKDGDAILDLNHDSIDEGWFGVNIHHSGGSGTHPISDLDAENKSVGRYSAGCQVFARKSDWAEAMDICEASGAEVFTYTLITEEEMR